MKLYYEYTDIGISKEVICHKAYEVLTSDDRIETYIEYENVTIPNPLDIKIPVHDELEVGLEKVSLWRNQKFDKTFSKLILIDDIWVVDEELTKEEFLSITNNQIREISINDLGLRYMIRTVNEREKENLENKIKLV